MKRTLYSLILLSILWILPCFSVQAEDTRELTLMIYMCGGNLESEYGSATADMQEILQSGFDSKASTVLVMAGGSENWSMGFDPEEISISEFGARGSRIVWHEKTQNMGEPETLTQLLRFGREQYPARKYALILWNHGGGPMEGLCWDELFEMDHLSLSELTEAIGAAKMPEKLSWIGFDACLMGSAEVACALSPYAEYMIASQEMEPTKGWNYAFLTGIEKDASGAETGKRIVDCFFDALSDSNDILTLSCIDLSQMNEVVSRMDEFFHPILADLSAEDFAFFSNIRKSSTGFGKAVLETGASSYDLVDLKDLISHYGGASSVLEDVLSRAVVYNRFSEEGAGGLSVYHPYNNKEKYAQSWRADYSRLSFSKEYARYLEWFGTILTGTQLADWKGLVTDYKGVDENNNYMLSMSLTEEQQMDISSVQLMILRNFWDDNTPCLAPLSMETAELLEDGTVSARYGGRSLYVTDDDGNILAGPVSFLLSEDGSYYTVVAEYYDYSTKRRTRNDTRVMYHCVPDSETGDLEIVRTYVYDRTTKTYSSRIPFSPEGFTKMYFWYFIGILPEGKDPLPGFDEWSTWYGDMRIVSDNPAEQWHLRFFEDRPDPDLYAMFQITDIQQNVYSSVPIPLENLSLRELAVEAGDTSCNDYKVAFSAKQNFSERNPYVKITMDIPNTSYKILSGKSGRVILNGSRTAFKPFYIIPIKSGPSCLYEYTLSDEDLLGLTEICSIDFVSENIFSDKPKKKLFHLELNDCVLSEESAGDKSLAEFRKDGITYKLISLSWDVNKNLNGMLHVRNDTDIEWNEKGFLLANDVRLEGSYSFTLYPHTEMNVPIQMVNASQLTSDNIDITDAHRRYILSVPDALQKAGVKEIDRIELISSEYVNDPKGLYDHRTCFNLKESFPVPEFQEEELKAVPILEKEIVVSLESVLVGDNGIGIGLRLANTSDETMLLKIGQPVINNTPYDRFDYPYLHSVTLPAHTQAVQCFSLKAHDDALFPGQALESFSFVFICGNKVSEPAIIRFPEGSTFGVYGGSYFNAEDLEISPAVSKNEPMVLPDVISLQDPEAVHQIALKAPVIKENADQVEYCGASLSLLTWETAADETGEEKKYPVTRRISNTELSPDSNGEYTGNFSGLVLMIDDYPLVMDEQSKGDGDYELTTSNELFLYKKAEDYHPTQDPLSLKLGNAILRNDFCIEVHISSDKISLTDQRLELKQSLVSWEHDDRTNFYVSEAELGVIEYWVYYDVGLFHVEADTFPVKDTVRLSLVPADSLSEDLCIYYTVKYKDGSRHDCIVDFETGETIYS